MNSNSNYLNDISSAAYDYINEDDFAVFPMSNNKVPFPRCADCKADEDNPEHDNVCTCIDEGKLCHGFKAATKDTDVFFNWTRQYPDMNLAIRTGVESGIFVYEYDPKNGGHKTHAALIKTHGAFPNTRQHQSPSGGIHFFFKIPEGGFKGINGQIPFKNSGIDIKANGGYVVAPPTVTDSGEYVVINPADVADAPQWLLDMIRNYWTEKDSPRPSLKGRQIQAENISQETEEKIKDTVRYWAERIEYATLGLQNILLYTGSRVLYSLVGYGVLDETETLTALQTAAARGNHPSDRIGRAIRSGKAAAARKPDAFDVCIDEDRNVLFTFTQDDIGNANRVVYYRGEDIKYDPTRDRFYTWAGDKWVVARNGHVKNIVESVLSGIADNESAFYSNSVFPRSEAGKKDPKTIQEVFRGWAGSQRFARKFSDCMSVLNGRDELWCVADDFDVDAYVLNVANGLVDLKTGQLKSHTREAMSTQISEVVFDETATCPEFERFIKMTQPNREHRRYLQRIAGATLLGKALSEQVFFVHIGNGGNGKGVFLDTLSRLLDEYATTGQRDSFTEKRGGHNRIPADIASMDGKRMVVVDELNEGQKMDEAILKDITGGGKIKAEAKNMNPWEYTPKFTLHFRTNHMPALPTDKSIKRRFRPIKWTVEPTSAQWDTFRDDNHDDVTEYLLANEASGILNWLLAGLRDYLANGLNVPEDLSIEAVSLLEEQDSFLAFMTENTTKDTSAPRMPGAKIYEKYTEWCQKNGLDKPASSRALYKAIDTGKYAGRFTHETYSGKFHFTNLQLRVN